MAKGKASFGHDVKNLSNPIRDTAVMEIDFTYDDEYEESLTSVIDTLEAALQSIPEQHRETARLKIGGECVMSVVQWERPETDDEMAARKAWLKGLHDKGADAERQTYERLKLKFGDEAK